MIDVTSERGSDRKRDARHRRRQQLAARAAHQLRRHLGGRQFDDEAARTALAALTGPYLPWSFGAMRPTGLVTVCNNIVLHGRRRVVELGSGVSTVLLARLLTQRHPVGEFRLVTVEHDREWAQWVTGQLDREGLGGSVTVVHAPLRPHALAESGLCWYDQAALTYGLDTALRGEPIDLLVVDGPPAYQSGNELARYPALPVLRERLAPGATIVLDDIERTGEQEVLRRWEQQTGLVFDCKFAESGIATATLACPTGGPRPEPTLSDLEQFSGQFAHRA
jgi:predicted O-methyltransferase YrrM